jgi:murein DD-endopeptidase MepM/ murein hydrolase activator NlpD
MSLGTPTLAIIGVLAFLTLTGSGVFAAATTNNVAMAADRLAEAERSILALSDTVSSLRQNAMAALAKTLPPSDMIMPVNGPITSQYSRSRFHPLLQFFRAHKGIDVAAASGTRIVAPAAGRVLSVDRHLGYGLVVDVGHSGGVITRYAHLQRALVKDGDSVAAGQAIAQVGMSGLTTGPHLHFEVLVRGRSVDPIKFLASTHDSSGAAIRAFLEKH